MTTPASAPPSPTAVLLAWIEGECRHMAASLEGLDETQMRTSRLPSGWTPLGMLGHVRESTLFWLENVLLGRPIESFDEDAPWPAVDDRPAAEIIDDYLTACSDACAAVEHLPGDAPVGWWPEGAWGGYRLGTVTEVLAHLLADNAAHRGQMDIARELVDGGVWDYSTHSVRVP